MTVTWKIASSEIENPRVESNHRLKNTLGLTDVTSDMKQMSQRTHDITKYVSSKNLFNDLPWSCPSIRISPKLLKCECDFWDWSDVLYWGKNSSKYKFASEVTEGAIKIVRIDRSLWYSSCGKTGGVIVDFLLTYISPVFVALMSWWTTDDLYCCGCFCCCCCCGGLMLLSGVTVFVLCCFPCLLLWMWCCRLIIFYLLRWIWLDRFCCVQIPRVLYVS